MYRINSTLLQNKADIVVLIAGAISIHYLYVIDLIYLSIHNQIKFSIYFLSFSIPETLLLNSLTKHPFTVIIK